MGKVNIELNGITSTSTYPDGEMISLVNLRKKGGALEPVPPRKITKTLSDTYDFVFVHQLPSTGENWIGVKGNTVYLDTGITQTSLCSVSSLISVTQIGNVLNLIDSTGIKHLFWHDGEYKLISTDFDGTQEDIALPAGKIELRTNTTYDPPTVYLSDSAISGSSSEETVAEVIKGLFAKAISVERKRGYLKGFVLACTAYELFDGSVILHSNPVLIGQPIDERTRYSDIVIGGVECNYLDSPIVAYQGSAYGIQKTTYGVEYPLDEYRSFKLFVGSYFLPASFPRASVRVSGVGGIYSDFHYPDPADVDWEEYWTRTPLAQEDGRYPWYEEGFEDHPAGAKYNCHISTDLFLVERKVKRGTTPIPLPNMVGYMQVEGVNRFPSVISRRSEFQIKIEKSIPESLIPLVRLINVYITPEVLMYKDVNFKRTSRAEGSPGKYHDNYLPDLKSDEEIKEELLSQENFYKVKEIFPNDIVPGEWVTVDLKDKLGDSLRNQERLPQDPLSHHQVIPNKQYTYNSRLHVADYKRILSRGWPLPYLKQSGGLGQFKLSGESVITGYDEALVYAIVEVKTETGVSKVVRYKLPNSLDVFNLMPLLSYPDKRAKKITIRREYKGWPSVTTERGVCWATHTNPTVGDSKLIIGSGNGMFDDSLTGLTKSTTYYLRAYAIAGGNVYYGEEKSFTTQNGIAVLSTFDPVDPSAQVANSGGNITTDGGSGISSRGVCWSTSPNPTILDSKTVDGTGTGVFYSEMTGLTPSTTYYVRAYATNGFDTYYGSEYSFTTADGQERLTLGSPSDLTYVSVKIPILVEEGSWALQFPVGGVCWNTTGNPTTADNTLEVFDDFGSFVAEITGLTPGTTYYFRGYATTEIGTTYTSQIEVETPAGLLEVETLDIDPLYVGDTWAHVRGTVNDPTESGVIEFGICYSLSNTTPTVEDSVVVVPGSPDLFTGVITGLIPDMGSYYARAYAANLSGVYYGSVKTFYTNP